MNSPLTNLLREFIGEARLRGRRTKCPEERQAAKTLEQKFQLLMEEIESTDSKKKMSHATP